MEKIKGGKETLPEEKEEGREVQAKLSEVKESPKLQLPLSLKPPI